MTEQTGECSCSPTTGLDPHCLIHRHVETEVEISVPDTEAFTITADVEGNVTISDPTAVKKAWAEGYTAGHSVAMRRMSDEPNAPDAVNPYETEET